MSQNNNRNNQGNQQDNQKKKNSITDTNVALEPTAVVYNVDTDDLESFIMELFRAAGFQAQAVRSKPYRQAGEHRLSIHAFFNRNDKNFIGKLRHIQPQLRDRLDTNGYELSDEISEFLTSFIGDDEEPVIKDRKGYVIIELNVFYCLGLMLKADPNIHNVAISGIVTRKRSSIVTVTKTYQNRGGNNNNNSGDKFLALL